MSGWLVLADGGPSPLSEALWGIAWFLGAGGVLVGTLAFVVIGIRRLLRIE